MRILSIGDIVRHRNLHEGYDEEWGAYTVDDDKLLDSIEEEVLDGGCIIDWHECSLFPKSWIDLVIVLRCDHTVLWDRLSARGYSEKKIQENNEAEIMQVVWDDARESYDEEIVVQLESRSVDEIEPNIERIALWINNYKCNRPCLPSFLPSIH